MKPEQLVDYEEFRRQNNRKKPEELAAWIDMRIASLDASVIPNSHREEHVRFSYFKTVQLENLELELVDELLKASHDEIFN